MNLPVIRQILTNGRGHITDGVEAGKLDDVTLFSFMLIFSIQSIISD